MEFGSLQDLIMIRYKEAGESRIFLDKMLKIPTKVQTELYELLTFSHDLCCGMVQQVSNEVFKSFHQSPIYICVILYMQMFAKQPVFVFSVKVIILECDKIVNLGSDSNTYKDLIHDSLKSPRCSILYYCAIRLRFKSCKL